MKKVLLENISYNFLIRILSYIFSFLIIVYVTRTLQPEVFGRVSFVGSVAGYFIIFSALGMPIYGMRTCAENKGSRKDLSRVFNELFSLNLLFGIIGVIALLISVMFVPSFRENSSLFMVYILGIVFQSIGCEWLFKGLEEFRFIAIATFITKLIAFIFILLFVHSGKDVLWYVLFAVIAGYGSNLICFLNLHKHVDFTFRPSIKKEHIKSLVIFFLMFFAVNIYSNLDIAMLGFMTDNYETGLYTIASKIKIFLAITGGIVCTAILPHGAGLWKNGQKAKLFSLAEKSITWVCIVQLALTVFCFIFAKYIILLVGGESYLGGVTPFRVLLLSLSPIGFSNILGGFVLITCGLERKLLKAELIGAGVNFFANLIVIPLYAGVGASVTTVLSEVIVLILCVYYIKRELKTDLGLKLLSKMPKIAKESFSELKIFITNKFG